MKVILPSGDWAINLRNTLIHQYDSTFVTTLLRRIQHDLPALRKEVEALITEIDQQD